MTCIYSWSIISWWASRAARRLGGHVVGPIAVSHADGRAGGWLVSYSKMHGAQKVVWSPGHRLVQFESRPVIECVGNRCEGRSGGQMLGWLCGQIMFCSFRRPTSS